MGRGNRSALLLVGTLSVAGLLLGGTSVATPLAVSSGSSGAQATPVKGEVEHVASNRGGGDRPAVGIDEKGIATAVWRQALHDRSGAVVYVMKAARRQTGGRWTSPVTIGCGRPDTCVSQPKVGVDASGTVTVAWVNKKAVMMARRPANGPWQAPRVIAAADAGGHVARVRMAVARRGEVVAVWQSWAPPGDVRIRVAVRPPGGPWQAPVTLGGGYWPRVAVSAKRKAIVVYLSRGAYASRFLPGRGWSRPKQLSQWGFDTSVAMNASGRAAVVVNAMDAYGFGVWEGPYHGLWMGPWRFGSVVDGPVAEGFWAGRPVVGPLGTVTVPYYDHAGYSVARQAVGGAWTWTVSQLVPFPTDRGGMQLALNRSNDLAADLGGYTLLRPHGSTWSRPVPTIGRSLAIFPDGSALRMGWYRGDLNARQVFLR